MPKFNYKAKNSYGKDTAGIIIMNSEQAVIEYLKKNGMKNIRVTSGEEEFDLAIWLQMHKKIRMEELIIFCRQMYTLLRAGVSITVAIQGLSDASPGLRFKTILKDLVIMLEEGKELSLALEKYKDVFSPLFINLVRVGESSGNLAEVFDRLSKYLDFEVETKKRVKSATRYPTMVLIAILIALVILNIFVIPAFKNLFASLHAELPLPTKILLFTSNFMINYWPYLTLAIIAIVYGIISFLKTPSGDLLWSQYKLKIPLIGTIIHKSALANFAHAFALLYKAGVPMLEILQIVSNAVGNQYIAIKIQGMKIAIENGGSLSKTVANSALFPPLVVQMFEVGDQTGEIDTLLEEVAYMYEREIDFAVKKLSEAIEPILISVMAAMVAVLALGIFLPMWDMAGAMKKGGGH